MAAIVALSGCLSTSNLESSSIGRRYGPIGILKVLNCAVVKIGSLYRLSTFYSHVSACITVSTLPTGIIVSLSLFT